MGVVTGVVVAVPAIDVGSAAGVVAGGVAVGELTPVVGVVAGVADGVAGLLVGAAVLLGGTGVAGVLAPDVVDGVAGLGGALLSPALILPQMSWAVSLASPFVPVSATGFAGISAGFVAAATGVSIGLGAATVGTVVLAVDLPD